MKIKHSLFTRRQFLNGLLGGWFGTLAAFFLYPIVKFVFPPYKEPDKVILSFSEYKDMKPGTVKNFSWGSKPGLLKKNSDGSYTAFVAVCTHLDCNVVYREEEKKFFCACHDGWYDENGVNIQGPPPRPLRTLITAVEGEDLIVKKEGVE
jgi:Rieske Fe-S protein